MAFRRRDRRTVENVPAEWAEARGIDNATKLPIIIRVNRAYTDIANSAAFSTRIEASVALADPGPDGLVSPEEEPLLKESEIQLVKLLAREAALVAVVAGDGRHKLVFQSRVRTDFVADGETPTHIGHHNVTFVVDGDSDWTEYDRLLAMVDGVHKPAPAPVELVPDAAAAFTPPVAHLEPSTGTATDDAAVLDHLVSSGADLSQPRTVRHFVSVGSKSAQSDAAASLAGSGWDVEQRPPHPENPDRFPVVAVRHEVLIDPDAVAAARGFFEQVAGKFGGEYDGWEASI